MLEKLVALKDNSGNPGWLGEIFSYQMVGVVYGGLILIGIYIFILPNRQDVRVLYNQEI
ncbi:hypothetical protein [Alkaliphilus crotonatoxidans]